MVFNSYDFFLFFLVVYAGYLALGRLAWRAQNAWLLAAGYAYYAAWGHGFVWLLAGQTALHFGCSHLMARLPDGRARTAALWAALGASVGLLVFYKAASAAGRLALPVGLSFYTFQLMGYALDVHARRLEPVRGPVRFALFASFFPQVLSGPIERGSKLLPQIASPRTVTLEGFYRGSYLVFWGLFEKLFVADNLAKLTDPVFAEPPAGGDNGWMVLAASYGVFFRIFCDFDGYCNIARGLARMMGFELSLNFRWPFLVSSPVEYWKRWHMTLTEWFRDYVYTPMVFRARRGASVAGAYRAMFVVLVLVGLWHGLSWKFLAWGVYQGCLYAAYRFAGPRLAARVPAGRPWRIAASAVSYAVFTYFGLCLATVLFWTGTHERAWQMTWAMATGLGGPPPEAFYRLSGGIFFYIWIVVLVGLWQKHADDVDAVLRIPVLLRAVLYAACYVLLAVYGTAESGGYVYFGF